jgi:hypothetical protein
MSASSVVSALSIEFISRVAVTQALAALVNQSGIPRQWIEERQAGIANDDDGEGDDDDEEYAPMPARDVAAAKGRKDAAKKYRLKLLNSIVDPLRRMLSTAETLYVKKQNDSIDLVRSCAPRSRQPLWHHQVGALSG